MPRIWSYCDPAERGYGIFKRNLFKELERQGWAIPLAVAPLLDPSSKAYLRRHFFENTPDWILLINQSAAQFYDYLDIPAADRPHAAGKIVWYLDDPRFFMDRPFEAREHVFCFDETYLTSIQEFCPGSIGFLPLAADRVDPGCFDERFACEVSFVGGVIDQSARRNQLGEEMVRYVEELVSLFLQRRDLSFEELSREHPFRPGKAITITPAVAHYLYWEANNRYRIGILASLMEFDLRIYGNEDWETLLADSPLRSRFFGPADPVKDLPRIFASSRINLNIHSVQCRGSLNQRDFNAPVAGGFLLSDWVPAAGKYLLPGREAVFWKDRNDLRDKVRYYLAREEEREEVVRHGRLRVLREHTYSHRVQQLLRALPSL